MIAAGMKAQVDSWADTGAPSFDVLLLADAPEPHDLRERAQVHRARFQLTCDLGKAWTIKRLAFALNDWLADGPFMAGAVVDAALAAPGRATFDIVVWHRGGGVETSGRSPAGTRVPLTEGFFLARSENQEGDRDGCSVGEEIAVVAAGAPVSDDPADGPPGAWPEASADGGDREVRDLGPAGFSFDGADK